jgi:quinol monooxygenase YgiN
LIIVTARITCKEGADAELTAAAAEVIGATLAEPGCLTYTLLKNLAEPSAYVFYEEWADYAALREHFGAEHLKKFQQAAASCAADQQIQVHTVEKSWTL